MGMDKELLSKLLTKQIETDQKESKLQKQIDSLQCERRKLEPFEEESVSKLLNKYVDKELGWKDFHHIRNVAVYFYLDSYVKPERYILQISVDSNIRIGLHLKDMNPDIVHKTFLKLVKVTKQVISMMEEI